MVQGRGSAAAITAVLCLLLLHLEAAQARVYTVGDGREWTFNVTNWTKGKRFRAGDVLVFKYGRGRHNVVTYTSNRVSNYYNLCIKPPISRIYTSGYDKIKLSKGNNYFICSFPGHCQAGMKIAIRAT